MGDVWGYDDDKGNNYAFAGTVDGVSILNITNPSNISEINFISYANAEPFGWYDMKTYKNYLYFSTEGSDEIAIVNLSSLPDPVSINGKVRGLDSEPHNIYIDESSGHLYIVQDFDLRNVLIYDINSPLKPILVSHISIENGGKDAHDVFVQNSRLYVAEGSNPSIGIFDVSDPSNPIFLKRVEIEDAGYVHNVWVSSDDRYMVTTEETKNKTVKLWNIESLENIFLMDEYLAYNKMAHNAVIKNDTIFIAHYESGFRVLTISDSSTIDEIAYYDTYLESDDPNFAGAFGVYPFSNNGLTYVVGDSGLFVFHIAQEQGPQLSLIPSKLDFKNVEVDSKSDTLSIEVKNLGTESLSITDISNLSSPFTITQNLELPLNLEPYQIDSIKIIFSPTENILSETNLNILSNDINEPDATYTIEGRGLYFTPAKGDVYYLTNNEEAMEYEFTNFYLFSPNNGLKLIKEIDIGFVEGLAINSSGEIYITSAPSFNGVNLYKIDPLTGNYIEIGNTGLKWIQSLTFDAFGTLYAAGSKFLSYPQNIYTLDLKTANAESKGGYSFYIAGLAFNPLNQRLYGTSTAGELYIIDLVTESTNMIGTIENANMSNGVWDLTAQKHDQLIGIKWYENYSYILRIKADYKNNTSSVTMNTLNLFRVRTIGLRMPEVDPLKVRRKIAKPVNIYPNPFSERIFIELLQENNSKLVIWNLRGLKILESTDLLKQNEIDLANLTPGVYIFEIKNNHEVYKYRVIKN